jgi:hypothetical protein
MEYSNHPVVHKTLPDGQTGRHVEYNSWPKRTNADDESYSYIGNWFNLVLRILFSLLFSLSLCRTHHKAQGEPNKTSDILLLKQGLSK